MATTNTKAIAVACGDTPHARDDNFTGLTTDTTVFTTPLDLGAVKTLKTVDIFTESLTVQMRDNQGAIANFEARAQKFGVAASLISYEELSDPEKGQGNGRSLQ